MTRREEHQISPLRSKNQMSTQHNITTGDPSICSTGEPRWVRILALLLLLLGPIAGLTQGNLSSGETAYGNITLPGQLDTWRFTAIVDEAIVVRMGATNTANRGDNLMAWIRVFAPDGTVVGESFNISVFGSSADVRLRATNSGQFSVVVGHEWRSVGDGHGR
jgi:hypothetical protein